MLEKIGLTECSSTQHLHLPKPNSWFRRKQQIAGVWFSPDLVAENSMLLPFGLGIGDHMLTLIDLPTKQYERHHKVLETFEALDQNTTISADKKKQQLEKLDKVLSE
eukprot:4107436-Ditylum_brightwellii.AAC.1